MRPAVPAPAKLIGVALVVIAGSFLAVTSYNVAAVSKTVEILIP
jgi:hypothetical protein